MAPINILPILFLAFPVLGIVLLTLGLRGRPLFSSPHCVKCQYDLRAMNFMAEHIGTCPECGADLSQIGAVSFGRYQRRWKLALAGLGLVVLPFVLAFLLLAVRSRVVVMGPTASAAKPTPALLAGLAMTVDQPWDWQELERRLKAGSLSQPEVDKALGVLTADVKATWAKGQDPGPLPWSRDFLQAAITGGNASPAALDALFQAYYGVGPRVVLRGAARQGEPIAAELEMGHPWGIGGTQPCWFLRSIDADGATKLRARNRYGGDSSDPDQLSGSRNQDARLLIDQSLPPGEHELALAFDLGAVPEQTPFRGLDGKPGTLDKWPNPLTTWQTTLKRKIRVVAKGQPVITVVSDEQANPLRSVKIGVQEALVRPASNGRELVIKWKVDGDPALMLSYRVTAQAAGRKIDFGQLLKGPSPTGGTMSSMSESCQIQSLPASVTSIDIVMTPDPTVAEEFAGVEQIWGKPYTITGVPLQRFDLASKK